MGEESPFKGLDTYEVGPNNRCVLHFLDDQDIEGTAYLCKQEAGKRACYALGLKREGIIVIDGACESLNCNNTAMHVRN